MNLLNSRSLEILKHIVDVYVETGEPIGSLTVADRLGNQLSSATIRNVMAKLEDLGLLYSPHTSAGRLPTDEGLRFFVQGLLESSELSQEDKLLIEGKCLEKGLSLVDLLTEVSAILSGLSTCAGLVIIPKEEKTLKQVEFISLDDGCALAIMVTHDGDVENRIVQLPQGFSSSTLIEATNYLNVRLVGRTLSEAKSRIVKELMMHQEDLDYLAKNVIEAGLAVWSGTGKEASLIINGQSNLLSNIEHLEDLNTLKSIFSLLEKKENLINLLDASMKGDGIQIFIGAENEHFRHVGCSLVLSPYENKLGNIVGAIGVIGSTRINYGRVIPMVNYTSKILSRLLSKR
ncbi:heat-inducible transcriptional repressor HrcA [Alphaproteobacteria bacterium]|nr:heat-inducible transcriptional repressor HrcA [Alphaproteobacteria bacterium]